MTAPCHVAKLATGPCFRQGVFTRPRSGPDIGRPLAAMFYRPSRRRALLNLSSREATNDLLLVQNDPAAHGLHPNDDRQRKNIMKAHGDYLQSLAEVGSIVCHGPVDDPK